MPRGQQTPPEIQWAVIRLSSLLDVEQIASSLDLSVRTVKRITSHFHAYGTVPNPGENAAGEESQEDRHLPDVDTEAYVYPPPPPQMPPVILVAPWGAPGPGYYYYYASQEGNGYMYLPAVHASDFPPHAAPRAHAPSISQRPRAVSMADIPEIVHWFESLDRHEGRNKHGITFAPYGPMLREKGFRRLSQLSRDYVKPSDLVEWLGIKRGTAVFIMQYAQQDLEAVNAGQLI